MQFMGYEFPRSLNISFIFCARFAQQLIPKPFFLGSRFSAQDLVRKSCILIIIFLVLWPL